MTRPAVRLIRQHRWECEIRGEEVRRRQARPQRDKGRFVKQSTVKSKPRTTVNESTKSKKK